MITFHCNESLYARQSNPLLPHAGDVIHPVLRLVRDRACQTNDTCNVLYTAHSNHCFKTMNSYPSLRSLDPHYNSLYWCTYTFIKVGQQYFTQTGSLVPPRPLCFQRAWYATTRDPRSTQPRHAFIGRGQCTKPTSQRTSTFNNLGWSKVKCSSVYRLHHEVKVSTWFCGSRAV